jgi:hypothetical protein
MKHEMCRMPACKCALPEPESLNPKGMSEARSQISVHQQHRNPRRALDIDVTAQSHAAFDIDVTAQSHAALDIDVTAQSHAEPVIPGERESYS